jgi:hypothetical protein
LLAQHPASLLAGEVCGAALDLVTHSVVLGACECKLSLEPRVVACRGLEVSARPADASDQPDVLPGLLPGEWDTRGGRATGCTSGDLRRQPRIVITTVPFPT